MATHDLKPFRGFLLLFTRTKLPPQGPRSPAPRGPACSRLPSKQCGPFFWASSTPPRSSSGPSLSLALGDKIHTTLSHAPRPHERAAPPWQSLCPPQRFSQVRFSAGA